MTHFQLKTCFGVLISATLLCTSCQSNYKIDSIEGKVIKVDSKWDQQPDSAALALLAQYKIIVDSTMNSVIGFSSERMEKGRPESLLSNLVADVLKQSSAELIGNPTDIGLINMGGLRSDLPKGDITRGDIFEILPFENSLCILTVNGETLKKLFNQIAYRRGEGISGAKLVLSKDSKLISATVGNEPIKDDKLYTIATVDYVAEGNDGMSALTNAQYRICPPKATLRDIFISYVEEKAKNNEPISSKIEGRIMIK